MIYLTGDTHGRISRIVNFCEHTKTTILDTLIILGDSGFNYFLDNRDTELKQAASELPITLFCIRGNHEERPENVPGYQKELFLGDIVYYQPEYPNIKFAKDGGIYMFNNKRCLVLGGAYSVDKYYRLMKGWSWFESEQLTEDERNYIDSYIYDNPNYDYVLTHTSPYNTRPTHLFLSGIDQSKVDSSMEHWLQKVSDNITFNKWYFGHYHGEWQNGNYVMLYNDFLKLGDSFKNTL